MVSPPILSPRPRSKKGPSQTRRPWKEPSRRAPVWPEPDAQTLGSRPKAKPSHCAPGTYSLGRTRRDGLRPKGPMAPRHIQTLCSQPLIRGNLQKIRVRPEGGSRLDTHRPTGTGLGPHRRGDGLVSRCPFGVRLATQLRHDVVRTEVMGPGANSKVQSFKVQAPTKSFRQAFLRSLLYLSISSWRCPKDANALLTSVG